MKMFGHPVHPLLVHFPTALLPMDLVLSVLYNTTGDQSYYNAGYYSLIAAASTGLITMATGLADILVIPRVQKKSMALALYHGFLNGLIILIYCLIAYKAWQAFPSTYMSGSSGIIIKSTLIVCLFVGNYMGGRLIYKHHLGLDIKNELNETSPQ